jgi:YD repeat-containing protein
VPLDFIWTDPTGAIDDGTGSQTRTIWMRAENGYDRFGTYHNTGWFFGCYAVPRKEKSWQTVTFTNPGSQVVGSTIQMTASASSGLPVTFSVASGPGTISGSTLTLTGTGNVAIYADQLGTASIDAARAIQVVHVNQSAPPSVVAGISVANTTSNSARLSWLPSTGGSGAIIYQIYCDGVLMAQTSSTSIQLSGLAQQSVYRLVVVAKDSAGNIADASAIFPLKTWNRFYSSSGYVAAGGDNIHTLNNIPAGIYRIYTNGYTDTYGMISGASIHNESASGLSFGNFLLLQNISAMTGWLDIHVRGQSDDVEGNYDLCVDYLPSDDTPPSSPANLRTAAVRAANASLQWDPGVDNVGVAEYEVLKDGVLLGSYGATTIPLEGLKPVTTYNLQVRARDFSGNYSPYATFAFTTPPDTTAPAVPSGLTASNVSDTGYLVNWTAATDDIAVAGYDVAINNAVVSTQTTTSYAVTGAAVGTNYSLTVRAFDQAGNRSAWSSPFAGTIYRLLVQDGSPAVAYVTAGSQIKVSASPPSGKYFTGWTVTGPGALARAAGIATTFTAGAGDALLVPTFQNGYRLIVPDDCVASAYGGSAGATITVAAPAIPSGSAFAGWYVAWGPIVMLDPMAQTVTVKLSGGDVKISPTSVPANSPQPIRALITDTYGYGTGAPAMIGINEKIMLTVVATSYNGPLAAQHVEYSPDYGHSWLPLAPDGLGALTEGPPVWSSWSVPWVPAPQHLGVNLIRTWAGDGFTSSMPAYTSVEVVDHDVYTPPAVITQQPVNQSVILGDPAHPATATFSVAISGPPGYQTFTYQWEKDGRAVPGATAAAFTISRVAEADLGSYRVYIADGRFSYLSRTVTLTAAVAATPFVFKQPVGREALVGDTVQLTVTPGGNPPPTLQWQKNGVAIPGATSATLTLSNVQLATAGNYSVVLTGTNGSTATSDDALVSVFTSLVPAVTGVSKLQVKVGQAVDFHLTATHFPTFTVTGLPSGLVSDGSGHITGTATQSGTFNVVVSVSNAYGSAQSTISFIAGSSIDGTVGSSAVEAPETDGTYADLPSSWPSTTTNSTDVVGFTHVDFSVNASGEATAKIPIAVTPGVAGLQPELALAYNHNGGNGYLGVGWSLQGLSMITRRNGTLATDGAVSPINMDANDHFALDGQKLIQVAGPSAGTTATEYRTEIDGYGQIFAYPPTTGTNYGPERFVVKTKSGLTMEYGASVTDPTTGGRLQVPAGTQAPQGAVVAWAVDTITDRNGNVQHFYYTKTGATGEMYISKITYLASEKGIVEFFYEDRGDVASGFLGGAPWARTKRLWKIEARYDTSVARRYEMGYDRSPGTSRCRLTTVTEFDSNGNALPPVACDYRVEQTTWNVAPAFEPPVPLSYVLQDATKTWYAAGQTGSGMVDVDGDGIPDLLSRHPGTTTDKGYIIKGTRNGWSTSTSLAGFEPPLPLGYTGSPSGAVGIGCRFVDLNADGYPDFIRSVDDNVNDNRVLYVNSSSGWTRESLLWQPTAFNISSTSGDEDRGVRFVDLDGDGRVDVIWSRYVGGSGQAGGALRNTPTGWVKFPADPARPGQTVYDPPEGFYICASQAVAGYGSSGVRLIDINGDGLPDLLRNWPLAAPAAYLNTGSGWKSSPAFAPLAPISRGMATGSEFIDINGDGLPDQVLCEQNVTSSSTFATVAATYLNTGKGWVTGSSTLNLPQPMVFSNPNNVDAPVNEVRYGVVFQDFNGDGLVDMAISTIYKSCQNWKNAYVMYERDPNTGQGSQSRLYFNTGSGWIESPNRFNSPLGYILADKQGPDIGTQVIDVNGDGMVDVVEHYLVDGGGSSPLKQAYLNPSRRPDLLEKITYAKGAPNGITTSIDYTTIAGSDNPTYTRGARNSVPGLIDVQDTRSVVRTVTNSDGIGGAYTLSYSYAELRQDLKEGALGFARISIADGRTGKKATTYYRQDFPYIGLPWKAETAVASGRVIERSTTTWANQTNATASRIRSPYAQQVVTEHFDPDGTTATAYLTTTTTVNGITSWGDVSDQTVSASDGYGVQTVRSITYATAAGVFPGQIQKERDTVTGTTAAPLLASSKTRTTDITYDSVGRVSTREQEPLAKQNPTAQELQDYRATAGAKAFNVTTTLHYDSYGNTDTVTISSPGLDADRATSFVFGSMYEGRFLTSQTDAESHTSSFSDFDNALGVAKTITDQNSLVTTFVYDGLGRITRQTSPGSLVTTTARRWAAAGMGPALSVYHVETVTDGQPPSLVFYDAWSRPLRSVSISADDRLTLSETYYDSRGNAIASTRPHYSGANAYATYTKFDAVGRVESVSYEGQLTIGANDQITAVTSSIGMSTFAYTGNTSTETKPAVAYTVANGVAYTRSATVQVTRNSLGKTTEVVETGTVTETGRTDKTSSATISYAYDGFGELEVIVDPITATTTYTVDAYGRRTQSADPNRGAWTFGYNPLGELTSQTDQNAKTTTTAYDRLGRTKSRTIGTLATTWTWDSAPGKGIGKLSSVASFGNVTESYEYDSFGRPSKATRTLGTGSTAVSYARVFGYDT